MNFPIFMGAIFPQLQGEGVDCESVYLPLFTSGVLIDLNPLVFNALPNFSFLIHVHQVQTSIMNFFQEKGLKAIV